MCVLDLGVRLYVDSLQCGVERVAMSVRIYEALKPCSCVVCVTVHSENPRAFHCWHTGRVQTWRWSFFPSWQLHIFGNVLPLCSAAHLLQLGMTDTAMSARKKHHDASVCCCYTERQTFHDRPTACQPSLLKKTILIVDILLKFLYKWFTP